MKPQKNSSQPDNQIIFWAFDPTQDPAQAKNIIKELKTWSRHLHCDVQPLTLFSRDNYSFPIENASEWHDSFEETVRQLAQRYIKKSGAKFLPPLTVFSSSITNRGLAEHTARYARDAGALMIVANTRATKKTGPLRLGGFAETLVATSEVPVLLLNRNAPSSQRITKVLYPTNFDSQSKAGLQLLKPYLKAFHAKALLFNQIENPNIFPWDYDMTRQSATGIAQEKMRKTEELRAKKVKEFAALLDQEQIPSEAILKRQKDRLSAEILAAAKKQDVGLIALTSMSGPLLQSIFGSTAQDILCEAKCPVLVFRQTAKIRPEKRPRGAAAKNISAESDRSISQAR